MRAEQIVPIVTSERMTETRTFYVDLLGFELSFEHDHYLGLRAGARGAAEIGFMRIDADAPIAFAGQGVTLAISVADADAECERLRRAGVTIVREPTDQPWGARSFMVTDPNGVALFISHPIAATPDFTACIR